MHKNKQLGVMLLEVMLGVNILLLMFFALFSLNLRINSYQTTLLYQVKAQCFAANLASLILSKNYSYSRYCFWKQEVERCFPQGVGEVIISDNALLIKISWQIVDEKKSCVITLKQLKNA